MGAMHGRVGYSMLTSLDGYSEDAVMEPHQAPHGRIAFERGRTSH